MVNFYVYRVKNGLKKWTDVPTLWREEVKKELVAQGYVLNEDGTVSKEEQCTPIFKNKINMLISK